MKGKQWLSVVLALGLGALLFTGCTSTAPASNDPTAPAQTIAADDDQAQPTAANEDVQGSQLMLLTPNLVEDTQVISTDNGDDGTYREELLYDGMVSITVERLASVEYSQQAVEQQITQLSDGTVTDLAVSQDEALSAQLTYPVWRVTYTTGENEDTRTNLDIYVQADDWDFRFHTATPADAYEQYADSIDAWILALELGEAG